MISYPRTLVCYCRFDTVFIFSVNLYWYQNVFKSIPTNIVSLFGKTILMPNNWPSRSVLWWMSVVRNLEIRNMVVLSTFGLLLTCFCLGCLCKFDVCMTGKNYCIVYLYTQTSQIDCFRHVNKILRWIGSSNFKYKYRSFE